MIYDTHTGFTFDFSSINMATTYKVFLGSGFMSNLMFRHTKRCVKLSKRCLSQQQCYDVIISGGGMVGTAMAAALG